MLKKKLTKLTKIMFVGLTMAFCMTVFNPATSVKADMIQERESNDNPATADQISLNTWVKGTIQDYQDQDWYQFTIRKAGETHIEIRPDERNSDSVCRWRIQLYDANRNMLWNENVHSYKTVKWGWTPGKYYVRVEYGDGSAERGAYNLKIYNTPSNQWEKERYYGDKTLANANVISLNKQYTGTLYCSNDMDYYRLKLKGTNGVTFKFTIDDTVSDPGRWKIEFLEYNSRKSLGYDYVSANTTFTVPRCSGDLLVKISSWTDVSTGEIYHIKAASRLSATEFTSLKGGTRSAALRWKKVSNATGYYIYRSTSKDGLYKKVATVTGKTSYTDKKSLKNSGYYYYKIVAFRKSGSKISKSAATASYYTYVYGK